MSELKPATQMSVLRKLVKVLVVDDDEASFPVQALNDMGFTIEYWREVRDLRRMEEGEFDIIVLDIVGVAKKFSERDGIAVLESIKRANPNQIVVAFSGQSFTVEKSQFFKLADDTLPKPVDILTCKDLLDHLIRTKINVNHYWMMIAEMLSQKGVDQKSMAAIEDQLVDCVVKRRHDQFSRFLERRLEDADLAMKCVDLAKKLISLCSAVVP